MAGKLKEMDLKMQEPVTAVNRDQSALWNGAGGQAWVVAQETLDAMFAPFEQVLLDEARACSLAKAAQVLDIGCGTGATTLALARGLGPAVLCEGLDISGPMIELARARAQREGLSSARFTQGDAQLHALAPASYALLVSRFGVMFFDDPVAAFANLRKAARAGAHLRCIAWRSPAENPFMTVAEKAAAPYLPNLPPRQPGAPGQFAFADRERVAGLLAASGWVGIDIQPLDVNCTLSEEGLMRFISRLGPVGQALWQLEEPERQKVIDAMVPAFAPYLQDGQASYTAACWMLRARAPA